MKWRPDAGLAGAVRPERRTGRAGPARPGDRTASSGDRLVREDLCAEAIRLGRLLTAVNG
ncbi:hypothetical protein [Streptomyces sp. NPDC048669]|uniref:hypothetical protein n=1 Tax=Streptomyces sp. NPDC048669 TaxID=3155267 RepID=UPI003447C28C